MILRDENGVDWECTELGAGFRARSDGTGAAYRVLRCRPANNPRATPREVAVPIGLDLDDPYIQRLVLSIPYTRDD